MTLIFDEENPLYLNEKEKEEIIIAYGTRCTWWGE